MGQTDPTHILIKNNTARIVVLEGDVKMINQNMATKEFIEQKLDEHHDKQNGGAKKFLGFPISLWALAIIIMGSDKVFALVVKIIEKAMGP